MGLPVPDGSTNDLGDNRMPRMWRRGRSAQSKRLKMKCSRLIGTYMRSAYIEYYTRQHLPGTANLRSEMPWMIAFTSWQTIPHGRQCPMRTCSSGLKLSARPMRCDHDMKQDRLMQWNHQANAAPTIQNFSPRCSDIVNGSLQA